MKISARNNLKGKITKIIPGVVSTEITIEIAPGIEVVSVITKSSADNLHLTIGKEVYAVMKASEVMVAVE
ncbi:TOBE domain-containing protein [Calothrix rhizosoleniae]|uniref:TOBE domain-containing protein n=1 Tax=Calothrix rhizosoleniae TaxID=888997 RepID=UPI000B4998F0|nr:molybdopterin-binding protein [Calothrix rhizosoleniae]